MFSHDQRDSHEKCACVNTASTLYVIIQRAALNKELYYHGTRGNAGRKALSWNALISSFLVFLSAHEQRWPLFVCVCIFRVGPHKQRAPHRHKHPFMNSGVETATRRVDQSRALFVRVYTKTTTALMRCAFTAAENFSTWNQRLNLSMLLSSRKPSSGIATMRSIESGPQTNPWQIDVERVSFFFFVSIFN